MRVSMFHFKRVELPCTRTDNYNTWINVIKDQLFQRLGHHQSCNHLHSALHHWIFLLVSPLYPLASHIFHSILEIKNICITSRNNIETRRIDEEWEKSQRCNDVSLGVKCKVEFKTITADKMLDLTIFNIIHIIEKLRLMSVCTTGTLYDCCQLRFV